MMCRLLGASAALALALPAAARAQDVGVSAVALSASHYLLGDPLAGAAVDLRVPRTGARLTLRLGAEWLRGSAERTGIPCAGLIPPGACPPERLRDETRLAGATGGGTFRVLGGPRASLSLTADASVGSLRAVTRGLTSGDSLQASERVWGGHFGVEAAWAPLPRVPLVVELGGAVGGLMPVRREVVLDGYSPFDRGFDVTRLRLGVAWRGGAAPPR